MSFNWKELLKDSSRHCIETARDYLIENPKYLKDLINLVFDFQEKYSGRAIRTICYCLQLDNTLFKKEIKSLLWRYKEITNESVEFHFFEIYVLTDLPKKDEEIAELTNICFEALIKRVERIAIKVYAAEILFKIVKKYPDLKRELIEVLKLQSENAPISLKNTTSRIIKELSKRKSKL